MSLLDLIIYGVFILGLVSAFFLSINRKKHLLSSFFILFLLIELLGYYLHMNKENNLFTYHVKSIIEIFFLFQLFKSYFSSITQKRYLSFIQLTLIILAIFLSIYVNPLDEFNVVLQIIEAIALILLASYYFYKTFDDNVDLVKTPLFWYATAIFIYFSTNIILFSSFYLALEVYKTGLDLWIINEISSVIFIVLFIIGINKEVKVVKT